MRYSFIFIPINLSKQLQDHLHDYSFLKCKLEYLITYLRLMLHLKLLVIIFLMTGFLQNLLAGWLWKGRLGRLRTSAWVFPTLMTRTFQRRKSNLRKYTKRQWETSGICFFHERWLLRPWSRRRNIQLENNHHHQFFLFFQIRDFSMLFTGDGIIF